LEAWIGALPCWIAIALLEGFSLYEAMLVKEWRGGMGKEDLLAGEWKLERGVERVSERLFTRSRRREGVVTSCGQPYLGSSALHKICKRETSYLPFEYSR
jgi:hypothetical protein